MSYDGGIADCKTALEVDSKCAEAHVVRGLIWFVRDSAEKGLPEIDKALEIDPKCAHAHYSPRHDLGEQVRLRKGHRGLHESPVVRSQGLSGPHGGGNALRRQGQYDRAINDYSKARKIQPRKAPEINPQLALAYADRGAESLRQGEYQKAIDDCEKAIELNPELAEAYVTRAAVRLHQGEYGKAIADCNDALKRDRYYVDAYFIRGDAREAKADRDKAAGGDTAADYTNAVNDFTQYLNVNPHHARFKEVKPRHRCLPPPRPGSSKERRVRQGHRRL